MDFLEKNLDDIIFETDNQILQERGLHIWGKKFRQLTVGNYGRTDIITAERIPEGELIVTIYELKNKQITWAAYHQAVRYAKGVDSYLWKRKFYNFRIKIVLIGSSVEQNSEVVYLTDVFNHVDIVTYKYRFDGIEFNRLSGFKLTNEGF